MTSCIICGSRLSPNPVISLGKQIYVNTYISSDNSVQFNPEPLELCVCSNSSCRHLQLSHRASPDTLFSNYFWETGTASTTKNYSYNLCQKVLHRCPNSSTIVEVASNDGTFLKPFQDLGLTVLGVEPAQNIASSAVASGIPTISTFFR